jgi:hypothetical protein
MLFPAAAALSRASEHIERPWNGDDEIHSIATERVQKTP